MKTNRNLIESIGYIAFIFLGLMTITTLIFWIFFAQEVKSIKLIEQANERQNIKLLQKVIENDIKVNAYNLIFLANHTKLHKWLSSRQSRDKLDVIRLFLNFSKEAKIYDQIRFIDNHGMELIRINYDNGQPKNISKNRLQNKADRYYFKEVIKLGLSQIFVSPFDLNLEQNKIEYPLKPMIRFGMPVYRFDGRKMGIVLLNYLGNKLIKNLVSTSNSNMGKPMLLNPEGFWLKALQPADEWGFMFPDRLDKKISLKDPLAWKNICRYEEGQFTNDKGLYSYSTIRFTDIGMLSSTGSDAAFKPYQNGNTNNDFYWKIVSLVSADSLKKLSTTTLFEFFPFYGLVLVLMVIISWWLGSTINLHIRAQKTLDQNEAELRSLFRSVPAGIGMVYNREIKQANMQLSKMTGYTKEELIGKSSRLLYPTDEEFESVGEKKYSQIKKKGTGSVETRWKRKDGKIIDVLLSSTPVNMYNLSDGVTFSAFDITNRKKAEEQVVASEERYRIIIESASDGIFTISRDCKFTSLNSALETLIGQKRSEWIGKTCLDLIYPDDIEVAKETFQQALNGNNPIIHEFKINSTTKRKYKTCEFKLKPKYNKSKELTGIVGFVRDITEYKQAQETVQRIETQLRHSQKMEAIGTLAGGIAHDFNNILSGIFGYAQLVEMNMESSDKIKHYISQVVKGAQRASALVQQILTFSRQSENKKQPLMISIIIKEALKLLRASIPSTIEIKEDISTNTKVMADSTQIHQVIMNLCTNAYHAMADRGGTIEIRLQEINISHQDSVPELNKLAGKYLKLEVSDTGYGIDDGLIERVFDPYFTTKKTGEGTGLGLALVRAIVEDHSGFIEVDTEMNKGTSFYIYLPVLNETVSVDMVPQKKGTLLRGNENILFVDDEEAIRLVFKDVLKECGYKVHTCKNGTDALTAFNKNPDDFDLVITDMTMPGISGDKLAINLLEIRPELPIILCTGYSDKMFEAKAADIGIKKFVQKPISNNELTFLIRQVLDTI